MYELSHSTSSTVIILINMIHSIACINRTNCTVIILIHIINSNTYSNNIYIYIYMYACI